MAGGLDYEGDVVEQAAADLARITRTLSSAERTSENLAGMIPHARLAGVVLDFANSWDRRRDELVEQLESVSAAAQGIADAFEQTDVELASSASGDN